MAEGGAPPPEATRRGMATGVVVIAVVVVFAVGFVGGLFASPAIFPPTPAELLIVGTNPPFAPFDFFDENGTLVGFTIDLVEEIGARAGFTILWREFVVWETLLAAGAEGAVDLIASEMTITPERELVYDFSDSYYSANQAALVHKDSSITCSDKDCSVAELQGKTWAVQTGTTSNDWVRDNLGEDCQTAGPLFCFGDVPSVLLKVRTGGADVAIMDLPSAVAAALVPANDLKAIGKIVTAEQYAFGVQEGDPLRLLPQINTAYQELVDEGFVAALESEWEIPSEIP